MFTLFTCLIISQFGIIISHALVYISGWLSGAGIDRKTQGLVNHTHQVRLSGYLRWVRHLLLESA
jgi:hypothetical protein